MDFRFSDEQRMLDDSASRFLAGKYTFETYRAAIASTEGYNPARWREMAELGWMASPFPEACGGFGGTLIDTQLIAKRLGERLCVDPWLTCALLPGKVLEYVGTPSALKRLEAIVSGEAHMALAALETGGHYDLLHINTRVKGSGGQQVLDGHKSVVFGAKGADSLLVTARDEKGMAVLLEVPGNAAGVSIKDYRVLDGSRAAEVQFTGVKLPAEAVLARGDDALKAVSRAVDVATVAQCADMLGAIAAVFRKTVEYARTRKQFGTTIGSFQVIQHYLVDMFVEVQQAESLVWMAGIRGDTAVDKERQIAVSTAKAYLCRSAVAVAQKAVQIHGGIGMTEELDVGHYFRRVTHYAGMYGDRDYHVSRYASLMD